MTALSSFLRKKMPAVVAADFSNLIIRLQSFARIVPRIVSRLGLYRVLCSFNHQELIEMSSHLAKILECELILEG